MFVNLLIIITFPVVVDTVTLPLFVLVTHSPFDHFAPGGPCGPISPLSPDSPF